MEPGRIFSTRPVNFKSTPVDRPVDWFFTEGFCSLFNACNKKFSKTAGEGMGEVIKFVTPYGSQKNALKNFCVFYKNNSILRPFLINFWFEIPVLSSAKHAQNKHKKNRKAQARTVVETDLSETKTEIETVNFFQDQDRDQDRSRSQFWLRDRDRQSSRPRPRQKKRRHQ